MRTPPANHGEQEVHAGISWSRPRADAKAIAEELKKGAILPSSQEEIQGSRRVDGGDLRFFTKESDVPEFSTVAFALGVAS